MKRMLLIAFTLLLSLQLVTAFQYEETCLNDTHIQRIATITKCVDNTCTDYNFTQSPVRCQWNCTNNQCLGEESSADYLATFLPMGLGIVFMIMTPLIKQIEFKNLKWLFFFFGMFLVLLSLASVYRIATVSGTETGIVSSVGTIIVIFTWVLGLSLFFFVLWFMFNLLRGLSKMRLAKKKEKWKGRE